MYRGIWDENKIAAIGKTLDLNLCEGYVVRNAEQFAFNDFSDNIAKWVRRNHVQTDEHWLNQAIVPNGLQKIKK